jgi:hypothetical protein
MLGGTLLAVGLSAGSLAGQEAHGAGDASEQHAEAGHGEFRNEIGLFLGNTRKSNKDAFTFGLEYLRALPGPFSVGMVAERVSSAHERAYLLVAGLWFEVLPHFGISVGGGVEREEFDEPEHAAEGEHHEDKTIGLLRVGTSYAFHFGSEGRWVLAPQAFMDISQGNNAWVLGAGVGYTF